MNVHFRLGVRDANRALGVRWPLAALAASGLVLGVAGLLEGQVVASPEAARAAQLRLLHGVAFGLVLPLFAFAVSGRVGGSLLELMDASWTRYGGDRRGYALGRHAPAALSSGLVATAAGWLALGLGSATSVPGLAPASSLANLFALLWVGLLGGLAYTLCFGLAQALLGQHGRFGFLVADWLLGSGTSVLALPWPRGHLRGLLGGDAPFGLAPRDGALCLVAIAVVAGFGWMRRVPR
jgi:hypothetical protein